MKEETKKALDEQLDSKIEEILSVGINDENMNDLYKIIDIHKDLANEDYWNIKKEVYKNEIQRL